MQSATMAERKKDSEVNLIGLKSLAEDLNEVATDWYTLGLQLDIEDEELRVVNSKENTAAECFRKTLREWLRTSTPTHDAIITALRSSSVGHKALATRLDSKDFREKRLKLGALINELSKITAEWHAFGIQLGVDPSKLKEFERYSCDVKRHLTEMLQLWLKQDPPPAIPDLLDALRGPSLNYRRLAGNLERKYKGCKLDTVLKAEDEEEVDLN